MKAISMMQPWAELAVIGAKQIETRSFNTKHRGDLLIHSSLGKTYGKKPNQVSCRELCYTAPFNLYITGGEAFDNLKFGYIIGKVQLLDTMQFGSEKALKYVQERIARDGIKAREELRFGDWSEGRWGWIFENPIKFEKPIACKGALSLWDFDLPIELM